MTLVTLQIDRGDFTRSRIVESPLPALEDGRILVKIDKFGLTANNVTYAAAGDMLGYWKFFPAQDPWGVVPVWGFGDVIESAHPEIAAGERLWGYWPMASHVVLSTGRVSPRGFHEASPHRSGLAATYNAYARTRDDPADLTAIEDRRALLFPLFATSYILCDYLADNGYFGAQDLVISSISSKTAMGLGRLVVGSGTGRPRVIGLTSPGNADYVKRLGVCDETSTYAQVAGLDASRPAVFVDMAGRGEVVAAVHARYGPNLKGSVAVGMTHWDTKRFANVQNSATPHKLFFAPAQLDKRDKDWGPGEARRRAQQACLGLVAELREAMKVSQEFGPAATQAAFARLVAGAQSPEIGVIASLSRAG